MPVTPYNVKNVLVGQAKLWTAAANTAMPANTLAAGQDWLTPWKYSGATEEGLEFAFERDTTDHRIEEQSTPVARLTNTSSVTVSVSLAEDTIENMKLSYGGGTITVVAAATGVQGSKTLALSDDLDFLAFGFEALNADGLPRRVYVPRGNSSASVSTAYRRVDGKRMYPVTLTALCNINEIIIRDLTPALP